MYKRILFCLPLLFMLFFSCATISHETTPVKTPPEIIPVKPLPPEYLMGKGMVSREKLAQFMEMNNPRIDPDYIRRLAGYYVEEAATEGINHDIAFAQMCLETGFLRFGNLVLPEQNNFAGLGATGPGFPGLSFPDPRAGVRAQIQHLQAYATNEPLKGDLINPRYRLVRRGAAPTIYGLAGTWAADPAYATKIGVILLQLYDFAFPDNV